jgi:predicted TIM-barrel enzyme
MTLIVGSIVDACGPDFQVGVQIMKNALSASLGVAAMTGANFIRATAWIGETDSAFGRVRSNPEQVCAYRRRVAPNVSVVADIHTPHFRWAGAETDLSRIAHWAVEAGADAVCVGDRDMSITDELINSARRGRENLSIILPGFTTAETVASRLTAADGVFVGTCLKDPNTGRIDAKRVAHYMDRAKTKA